MSNTLKWSDEAYEVTLTHILNKFGPWSDWERTGVRESDIKDYCDEMRGMPKCMAVFEGTLPTINQERPGNGIYHRIYWTWSTSYKHDFGQNKTKHKMRFAAYRVGLMTMTDIMELEQEEQTRARYQV